jgi:hypothetical protein
MRALTVVLMLLTTSFSAIATQSGLAFVRARSQAVESAEADQIRGGNNVGCYEEAACVQGTSCTLECKTQADCTSTVYRKPRVAGTAGTTTSVKCVEDEACTYNKYSSGSCVN